MTKNLLFATVLRPRSEKNFTEFCRILCESALQSDLIIIDIFWTEGRGCSNLAFNINGSEDKIDLFGKALNMQLQPGKWAETTDKIPEGWTHTFNLPAE